MRRVVARAKRAVYALSCIYSLYLVYHVVAAGVAAIAYILSEFFTLALASRLEASVSRCEDAAKGL